MTEERQRQPTPAPGTVRRAMGYAPEPEVRDSSVKKVASSYSPTGPMGQTYLASGKAVSMRLWEEGPGKTEGEHARPYETVGYVISGEAELHLEGQMLRLAPGDCWVVPKGAQHWYRILEPFRAVEATAPPAEVHGRDESEG